MLPDRSFFKDKNWWKCQAIGQTVLPDMSILIGQKLMENAKIEKNLNATF